MHRIRASLKIAALPALIVAIFGLYLWDKQNAELTRVDAVINSWTREQTEFGAGNYALSVTLSDGTPAQASANPKGDPPSIGKKIVLVKSQTPAGLVSYRWTRQGRP